MDSVGSSAVLRAQNGEDAGTGRVIFFLPTKIFRVTPAAAALFARVFEARPNAKKQGDGFLKLRRPPSTPKEGRQVLVVARGRLVVEVQEEEGTGGGVQGRRGSGRKRVKYKLLSISLPTTQNSRSNSRVESPNRLQGHRGRGSHLLLLRDVSSSW